MIAVMLMSVALITGLCVLAYTLAVYALPFMLAIEAARFAYATGSSLIGAGLVGLVAGAAAYGLLVFAFASLRSPVLRMIVALVFAAPLPSRATPLSTASRARPCRPKSGGKSSASSAVGSSGRRPYCGW